MIPSWRPSAPVAMLGASFAFAWMAACVKLAAEHGVPVGQILFYRAVISLVLMLAYLHLVRVSFATPHWKAHLKRGGASLIGMIAYFGCIVLLPLAAAVTLNYTSPLLLAVLLLVRYRERPQPRMVAAMLGGFVGIVLLMRPSYDSSQWLGLLLALASAVTGAIAALNISSLGRLDEPPSRTVAHFSLYILLGTLPWYLATDPGHIDPAGAALVLAVGVFATIGQVLLTTAFQRGHTLLVSLLGYSQVVFTTLIGMLVWGDRPGPGSWLAMALIIASGAFATRLVRTPVAST